ncbi:VRR-NUC domain-containing protein [Paenibacillus sp. y28]|uniref:VRR-NUC domain-containing protein n=1 Tax=Paenibacillus sp. y28 TaxID=3129110 RepID=UPI0030190AA9
MRESILERRLVREVKRVGGLAPKWVSPGNRGVPDRLVILPNGRTVYVEMKAPGKQLDPLQVRWAKKLLGLGHQHYKIDSNEDIDRFIAEVMPK